MNIIDISMELSEDTLTFPGNPAVRLKQYRHRPKHTTNETKIHLGSHNGTHVDAPRHVKNEAPTITDIPLKNCYGDCRVLDVTNAGRTITADTLQDKDIHEDEIILLKTENTKKGYEAFREDYAYIDMSAAEHLVQRGVKAIGTDYLSIKKFGEDDDVHEKLICNMTVYEGLDLRGVQPGQYTFIGFPLKIGVDGGPTRAVLLQR